MPLVSAGTSSSFSYRAPSSASLTSASASRVLRARHRAHRPAVEAAQRLHRRGVQRLHVGVLDLVLAVDLLGDELGVVDDLDLGRRRAPARAARPSSSPRYSATLFVATPSSSRGLVERPRRRASRARRRRPPGPGLPRAPPSTWTTSFTRRLVVGGAGRRRAGTAGGRRSRTRVALAALRPPVLAAGRRSPALAVAPVDDDLHVGVVGVVRGELVVAARARAPRARRSRSSREHLGDDQRLTPAGCCDAVQARRARRRPRSAPGPRPSSSVELGALARRARTPAASSARSTS